MKRRTWVWAMAAAAGVAAGWAVGPMAWGQPTDPRRQPESPYVPRREAATDLQVPPGAYWSLVFANAETGGSAAVFTVTSPTGSLVVAVRAGETVVVPCGPGWQLGVAGAIKVEGGGTKSVASALTPSGPVTFKPAGQ